MWFGPVVALAVLVAGWPALSFERLEGVFVASAECEAFLSKNKGTNPGAVLIKPGEAYALIGRNAPGGDFLQIRIEGAPATEARWVNGSCGIFMADAPQADQSPEARREENDGEDNDGGEEAPGHILALSWQSAFCETSAAEECRRLNRGELPLAEIRLSVHGLWPQPRELEYCGVSQEIEGLDRNGRWMDLPAPDLSAGTREALAMAMPGMQSYLERHQWIKHGSCYEASGGAEEYFTDTLFIADAVNGTEVVRFLARMLGEEIRTRDLRARFETAFGRGAGERVAFHCTNDGSRRLLQEVRIHLRGEISPEVPVSELILAADPVPQGCEKAIVDPFGRQ